MYFNEVHIHRKTKYNQDTLKFLSVFHHRVWQLPFTTILTEFILKTSYFQRRSRSKRSTFQRRNEPSRWCKSWEKLKKLWTKHHRVTLVKAEISFLSIAFIKVFFCSYYRHFNKTLTNAERMKTYRAKIKKDKVKHEVVKAKAPARYHSKQQNMIRASLAKSFVPKLCFVNKNIEKLKRNEV